MPAQYVPGRLNHVTPHSYFSWPRGWLLSKTPDRADLLETMFDGMGRAVPVGQSYYDDELLPGRFRNNLLVARWCIRAVTRYPLEHRGASFATTEEHVLDGQNQARPVGVSVGRGGRIFVTIAYMAQNEGSPVYRSDLAMITKRGDSAAFPFDPYDATAAAPERLWSELSNASWSRRRQAHIEIMRRGGQLLDEACTRLSAAKPHAPAREHLVWLAAANGSQRSARAIRSASRDQDPMVRLQAIRALTEFSSLGGKPEEFLAGLNDPDPQVQHAAVLGLFNFPGPVAAEVIQGPARSRDTYLRQAAALLLAEKASLADLALLCKSSDAAVRLAGVLAVGFRLTLPPATGELSADLPLDKLRSDEAYLIQFDGQQVDLRTLGRIGNYTVAEHWKQGAHSDEQEQLFALLQSGLADAAEPVRLQAAHFLSLLNDPRSEPSVEKVIATSEERRLLALSAKGVSKLWAVGPFPDDGRAFDAIHPPEQGPVDVSQSYNSLGKRLAWKQIAPTGSHFNLAQAVGTSE